MPVPPAPLIEAIATVALQQAGIHGQDAPGLARAMGQFIEQGLSLFLSAAMVLPGIVAAAPPPAGSGSTIAPGMLAPSTISAPQLEPLATNALMQQGIRGKNADDLAKVLAASLAQALTLFASMVQVAPGITISGFTTTAPGMLI
jgi:hypothetical protein